MANTKIEWAAKVWNPMTGCSHAGSSGCDNCYAERMSKRLKGRYGYPSDNPFRVTLHPDRLGQPLKWKKPRRIFVCSMGDLFHKDVPLEFISTIFRAIEQCNKHTFIVLTKRPERMFDFTCDYFEPSELLKRFPNLWLGISAENQERFDERWAYLKQIPAAVYMISYEPALGPLVLPPDFLALGKRAWLVCGGESCPKARPMHTNWARGVRDQCVESGVSYFFKQWGEFRQATEPQEVRNKKTGSFSTLPAEQCFLRVGKKAAGRELDSKTWSQFPGGTK